MWAELRKELRECPDEHKASDRDSDDVDEVYAVASGGFHPPDDTSHHKKRVTLRWPEAFYECNWRRYESPDRGERIEPADTSSL